MSRDLDIRIRAAKDIEQTIEDMPNVIRAKTGPQSRRFWG